MYNLVFTIALSFTIVHGTNVSSNETTETDSLSFFLLGDWGKGGITGTYSSSLSNDDANTHFIPHDDDDGSHHRNLRNEHVNAATLYQVESAAAMGVRAASMTPQPSFIVALGDNFYSNGVSSSTDSLWNYLWKNVYLGYEHLNINWFPVFGNRKFCRNTVNWKSFHACIVFR